MTSEILDSLPIFRSPLLMSGRRGAKGSGPFLGEEPRGRGGKRGSREPFWGCTPARSAGSCAGAACARLAVTTLFMRRHSLRRNSTPRRSRPDLRGCAMVLGVATLVAVSGLTHRAGAGAVVWVGSKSTNFGNAKNWKPARVPRKTDRAILDTAEGSKNPTITGAAGSTNQAIVVRNGRFSLSAAGGTYTLTNNEGHSVLVGALAGDKASLLLTAGIMSGIAGNLGEVASSRGTMTVTGDKSMWINSGTNGSGTLVVGDGGKGTLIVQDKGQVMNTTGLMGFSPGSSGSATVTGGGSK